VENVESLRFKVNPNQKLKDFFGSSLNGKNNLNEISISDMIIKINDNYYIKNNLYFDILKTKNYHNVFDNEKIIKPVSLRQENLVYFNLNKYPNDNYLINLKINLLNQINNLYDIYPRES
jgi:hypothetical protein